MTSMYRCRRVAEPGTDRFLPGEGDGGTEGAAEAYVTHHFGDFHPGATVHVAVEAVSDRGRAPREEREPVHYYRVEVAAVEPPAAGEARPRVTLKVERTNYAAAMNELRAMAAPNHGGRLARVLRGVLTTLSSFGGGLA